MSDSVQSGLNIFCERKLGGPAKHPKLITGGANMEMWSFECGAREYVLRRYRGGVKPDSFLSEFDLSSEARLIDFAHSAGVTAPEVVGKLEPEDGLGLGFVMTKAAGIALPQKLFKDPTYTVALQSLTDSFGRELAALHQSDPAPVADLLTPLTPHECFQRMREDFEKSGFRNPVLATAMHWLETHIPHAGSDELVVLHGDFRMGNILIDEHDLSAVLDWELAHLGCVEEDLAWICMPSWRFGRYTLEAGGVGTREELFKSYERHSDRQVDRGRFQWYLIYSSLKWGLMTAMMARMWRDGEDKNLERILIGTRISEVEADLLLLLEDVAGIGQEPHIEFEEAELAPIEGDVEASELLDAVGAYLSETIIPTQSGSDRFHALITANALSIANRAVTIGSVFMARDQRRLAELDHSCLSLFEALRSGSVDWREPGILSHMRHLCLERLTIHQPKYVAFKIARKKWSNVTDV